MAEILSLSPDLLTCGQSHFGLEAFIRAANNLFASELGRAAVEAVQGFPSTQSGRDALRRRAFARLRRECARKAPKAEDWVLHALIEMALQKRVANEGEPVSAMESFYL